LKILLELRPALDGHAGIPQETRLLFRTLASLPGVELQGLIQSSNKVLPAALPPEGEITADQGIDRQSRVVVALQQHDQLGRLAWVGYQLQRLLAPTAMVGATLLGLRTALSRFAPKQFEDFIWRSFFAKSLPLEDRALVTQQAYRVARVPWAAMHLGGLFTRRFGHAVYPRLDTRGVDAFIVETPYPGRVRQPTRMVVRYHDAVPLLMPHTIRDRHYHQAAHYNALRRNVADGAWFACVSEATRKDLLSVVPEVEARAVTIPNMISHHFFNEESRAERVPEIVWSRRNRAAEHGGGAAIAQHDLRDGKLDYLLVVATLEPRKNHLAMLEAWERLRTEGHPQLNLVFVGSLGWDHAAISNRMAPWLERGGLHLLEAVPADDLRLLYRHARATVCPSFFEGFDFSGVEAMCSGGVVVASDIPVHREIYADASLYFSPYASGELMTALQAVLGDADNVQATRSALTASGAIVAQRYHAECIAPLWQDFLRRVCA